MERDEKKSEESKPVAETVTRARGGLGVRTGLRAGLITEIGFPACDGASKDAAK